jgi:DNA-binding transcriptional ArsR family regulator
MAKLMANGGVYRALADPTRRQILRLLRERDMTAGELAERFPLAKSTLSGHFGVLRAAGLVQVERREATLLYSLNLSVLEEALAALLDMFSVGRRDGAFDEGGENEAELADRRD